MIHYPKGLLFIFSLSSWWFLKDEAAYRPWYGGPDEGWDGLHVQPSVSEQ